MRTSSVLLLVMVCLASAFRVEAQDVENPHGDFREDCRLCHTANAWSPMRVDATFDHSRTGFALQGAHADTPCLLCHETLEFKAVQGNQCADCHQDVHLGELGPDCARCHSSKDFIDRSEALRQHRTSRFPLTGAHLSTDCAACHTPSDGSPMRFVNTPVHCESCHMESYRAASNPNHLTAGFSTDCSQCHATLTWGAGDFDHALTAFPLTGAHTVLQCQSCHTDLTFADNLSAGCSSCHLADAQAATNPAHTTEFSTNCTDCHATNAWQPAAFDHAVTAFALTGAHVVTSCADCHVNNTYAGTPQECSACHLTAYQATTQPAHASAGYSTNCAQCHTTSQWLGANVDHNLTAFPLTGAHLTASCTQCHVNNTYAGTPQDCYTCHTAEYQGTSQPQHSSAGFSTDCASCHTTSQWLGATFDHDGMFFPIYTGRHTQAWNDCSDCHVNANNFAQFECILCHEHSNEADLADKHQGRNDYAYTSAACYSCHPDGRR